MFFEGDLGCGLTSDFVALQLGGGGGREKTINLQESAQVIFWKTGLAVPSDKDKGNDSQKQEKTKNEVCMWEIIITLCYKVIRRESEKKMVGLSNGRLNS